MIVVMTQSYLPELKNAQEGKIWGGSEDSFIIENVNGGRNFYDKCVMMIVKVA